jgi:hypothetical protein
VYAALLSDEEEGEPTEAPAPKKKRTTAVDVGLELIELEREKLRRYDENLTKTKSDDADTNFFLSLIPDFKTLNPMQKLRLRVEVQSLLLKYMTEARDSEK